MARRRCCPTPCPALFSAPRPPARLQEGTSRSWSTADGPEERLRLRLLVPHSLVPLLIGKVRPTRPAHAPFAWSRLRCCFPCPPAAHTAAAQPPGCRRRARM